MWCKFLLLQVTLRATSDENSCAWISVGTYHASNLTLGWRLPLSLACVGPLALLAGLPFVPG
jgi:hypothetical protein